MLDLNRREHLLNTSLKVFNQYGYHRVGIDFILKEAVMSKKTMYKHFRSKNELILAVLQKQNTQLLDNLSDFINTTAHTPLTRLQAVFVFINNWIQSDDFYGCMFTSAVSEFPEENSPIREVSKQFKYTLNDFIFELCEHAKLNHPRLLAEELTMLIDGATVIAQVRPEKRASDAFIRSANNLIHVYTPVKGKV
jgi:AcrR family transcriptional regulator